MSAAGRTARRTARILAALVAVALFVIASASGSAAAWAAPASAVTEAQKQKPWDGNRTTPAHLIPLRDENDQLIVPTDVDPHAVLGPLYLRPVPRLQDGPGRLALERHEVGEERPARRALDLARPEDRHGPAAVLPKVARDLGPQDARAQPVGFHDALRPPPAGRRAGRAGRGRRLPGRRLALERLRQGRGELPRLPQQVGPPGRERVGEAGPAPEPALGGHGGGRYRRGRRHGLAPRRDLGRHERAEPRRPRVGRGALGQVPDGRFRLEAPLLLRHRLPARGQELPGLPFGLAGRGRAGDLAGRRPHGPGHQVRRVPPERPRPRHHPRLRGGGGGDRRPVGRIVHLPGMPPRRGRVRPAVGHARPARRALPQAHGDPARPLPAARVHRLPFGARPGRRLDAGPDVAGEPARHLRRRPVVDRPAGRHGARRDEGRRR